jgi:hypothetical protein
VAKRLVKVTLLTPNLSRFFSHLHTLCTTMILPSRLATLPKLYLRFRDLHCYQFSLAQKFFSVFHISSLLCSARPQISPARRDNYHTPWVYVSTGTSSTVSALNSQCSPSNPASGVPAGRSRPHDRVTILWHCVVAPAICAGWGIEATWQVRSVGQFLALLQS